MSLPVPPSPVWPLLSTRPTSCLQSLQLSLPDDERWAASVMPLVFSVRLVSSWYIDCITNAMSAQCPTVITTQTPTEKIFCHRVPSYLFTVRERQRRKVYIQVSHSVKIFSQAKREPGTPRESLHCQDAHQQKRSPLDLTPPLVSMAREAFELASRYWWGGGCYRQQPWRGSENTSGDVFPERLISTLPEETISRTRW